MAMLQRSRVLADQRLDKPDRDNVESFVCADFAAIHKYVWTPSNYVFSGFKATGEFTDTLSVALAGSAAVIGADEGLMYIGAPTLSALETSVLTPSAVNYVEIFIDQDTGGSDSRAFWDQTAAGGAGGEFSQIVDTFIFQKASFAINTSNFTSDANKLPIAEVTVDGGGSITSIVDARPMFYRLGKPSDAGFAFNWANGRSAENPAAPSYDDPDKVIDSLKDMFDALMDGLREVKGTDYWYEAPFSSLLGIYNNHILSIMTGANNSSSIEWTGTDVIFTDNSPSGSPDDDVIAYIRLLASSADLALTRQDTNAPSSGIALSDGEILWVEIPDPKVNTNYTGTGASLSNYRVSPRGSIPVDDSTFWLAFREGNRLYLRGYGELESGESVQISDETSKSLITFLGFNPETASLVPYTSTPSAGLNNAYSTASTLVTAISTNAKNINEVTKSILLNYRENLLVTTAAAADDNEVQGPITSGATLTLPLHSLDSNASKDYVNGKSSLQVRRNGILLKEGDGYSEDGSPGSSENTITILVDLEIGEELDFEITTDVIEA